MSEEPTPLSQESLDELTRKATRGERIPSELAAAASIYLQKALHEEVRGLRHDMGEQVGKLYDLHRGHGEVLSAQTKVLEQHGAEISALKVGHAELRDAHVARRAVDVEKSKPSWVEKVAQGAAEKVVSTLVVTLVLGVVSLLMWIWAMKNVVGQLQPAAP